MNLKASRPASSFSLFRIGIVVVQIGAAIGLGIRPTALPALAAPSQITGVVFEDFNSNGAQDTTTSLTNDGSGVVGVAVDRGIGGVTVKAFDNTGAEVGTATSASPSGAYTINIGVIAGPYRIEFSGLPTGYQPSFHGANNGTSVQFVPDGNTANVNFGVVLPGNYCQNNPTLYTNCYRFGASNGANASLAALYSFPYSAGSNGATIPPYDVPAPTLRATVSQIGVTYGLAYARGTQRVYASAYFKKHAGFGPGADGTLNTPDDAGAIYVIDPATNAVVGTFTVPNATANSHNTADYFNDNGNAAWDAVGKISLGGMALSPDESVLYAMNLENRTLYALNATTGAVVTSAAAPLTLPLPAGGTCTNVNTRPFAVSVYDNTGYIGLTCTGPTATELRGYIYTFNLSTLAFGAAPAFQFALNYTRGIGNTDPNIPGSTQSAVWNSWVGTFTAKPPAFGNPNGDFPVYPQPVLANVAFDAGGNMILGLRDRFGDQMGNQVPSDPANPGNLYAGVVAGDTLRACGAPSSGWTLESNARCGGTGAGPQSNGQGPDNGEFYWRDEYAPFHDEVSLGAVAQIPGYPDVVVATYNPVPINGTSDTTFDSGVRWMNNTSGDFGKGYRVYNGTLAQGNLFGKAAGLGDMVVLCDAAPIELGNRVWIDTNGNGRQDPNETPGLGGVTVGLYDSAGNLLVTTSTAPDGTYYFTATNAAGTNRILPNTGYQIRVDTTQPALASYSLTTPNSVAGGNGAADTSNNAITDVRDSDVVQSGNFGQVVFTTGAAGATNHGFDIGLVADTFDWGDNPDTGVGTSAGNYKTLLNDDSARHKIVPGLLMGAIVDAETNGQPNAAANGDDITPANADDEDGVIVADLTLTQGSPANVRVNATNTTGQAATLCGFIDLNGDGDFGDVGETTSIAVPTGSNNVQFTLAFGNVPAGAAAATYARFRLGYEAVCAEGGAATAGEVEDYPVTINAADTFDWGDNPDTGVGTSAGNYKTLLNDDSARHKIVPGLLMGAIVDAETNGQPNAAANGDDITPANADDEDGVTVADLTLTQGSPANVRVNATNTTGQAATLCGFIDFNGDGDFGDTGESVSVPVPTGSNNVQFTLAFGNVPAGAAAATYARFRLSYEAVCAESGAATAGEVEDYPVTISAAGNPVNLGNQVWYDTNNNGILDSGEVGTPGVRVELYRDTNGNGIFDPSTGSGGDTFVGFQTTIPGGYYTFTNLAPSTGAATNYLVVITSTNFVSGGPLAGYRNSTPTTPSSNSAADDGKDHGNPIPSLNVVASTAINLTSGNQPYTTTTPGDSNWTIDFGFYALTLGNLVWDDLNNNGLREGTESGLPDVTVQLLDSGGNPITDTVTDANGIYTFTNLVSGTYSVRISTPAGYVSSSDIASTANPDNNIDNDDNGLGNAAGVITSSPITLIPGSAGAANNNTVNPATGSTTNPTMDFGVWRPAALGDYVWVDTNKNGIQDEPPSDGKNDVLVTLYRNGVAISTTTTANGPGGDAGYYLFDNLLPGTYSVTFQLPNGFNFTLPNQGGDDAKNSDANQTTGATGDYTLAAGDRNLTVDAGLVPIAPEFAGLGDFVWNDLNKNGIQDSGEPGVPGITVTLYNQAGTAIDTILTNASGYYSFTGLPPGTYSVGFTLPQGYTFTIQTAGSNDQIDSNADPITGRTAPVTLAAGEFNPTIDAGVIAPLARLGDYVWNDVNRNGIQDVGEPGIPGVTVTLRTPSGTIISTTLTNGGGVYHFDDLQPGSYQVCFALPPGYVFTPPNLGGNDGSDSDADMVTGCAPVVILGPGDSNQTIDAGMYIETGSPLLVLGKLSVPATGTTVKPGDLITYTLIVTNTGNAPANNVRVSDNVPTETTYVAGSATPALESGPSPVVWNVGTLNPGQSKTVKFVVRVIVGSDAIPNVGTTSSDETPPTPSNQVLNPRTPTAITLAAFNAAVQSGGGVMVTWRTSLEFNTFGFYVLRSTTGKLDDATRMNAEIVLAKGVGSVGSYEYFDASGAANNTYWLQEMEVDGDVLTYNPAVAQVPAAQSPITSPQPEQQPRPQVVAYASVSNPGGAPIAIAGVGSQGSVAGNQAAAPTTKTGPETIQSQPAMIAPVQTQAQLQAQAVDAGGDSSPVAKPEGVAAAAAQHEQAVMPDVPAAAAASERSVGVAQKPGEAGEAGEAIGASKAVELARGGDAASGRMTRAQTALAQVADAMPGLLAASVLMLMGAGVGTALVIRRRRKQM